MPLRKLTVTNAQLLELSQGISLVDNGYQLTVDGKNVARGFKLTAAVRYALARTAIVIKPLIEAWKDANTKTFETYDPQPVTLEDGREERLVPVDRRARYEADTRALLALPVEVELPVLELALLRVGDGKDENPIPALAITYLDPILVWPAESDA